jgi:hypothetical protein
MTRTRLSARALLATLALLAMMPVALAVSSAPASASSAAPTAPTLPPPGTCPVVRVDSAEIVRTVSGPAIQVTGVKPHADTLVLLEAEQVVYVQQPDYWNYFVVGCGGSGPVVKAPFTKLFRVPTDPVGRYGITVNGIPLDLFGDGGSSM